jgi:hypothetical protein
LIEDIDLWIKKVQKEKWRKLLEAMLEQSKEARCTLQQVIAHFNNETMMTQRDSENTNKVHFPLAKLALNQSYHITGGPLLANKLNLTPRHPNLGCYELKENNGELKALLLKNETLPTFSWLIQRKSLTEVAQQHFESLSSLRDFLKTPKGTIFMTE